MSLEYDRRIKKNKYDICQLQKKIENITNITTIPSELEKITENGQTGWRLLGRNPDNYGDIGEGAVDFSYSDNPSSENGATGNNSFAEGESTKAEGDYSHAEGKNTKAQGWTSHAEGYNTKAEGDYSHAEGKNTKAESWTSHAEGYNTKAESWGSHAEGTSTTARGENSHAEGENTIAEGNDSHAEGYNTKAKSWTSHAEGYNTTAEGWASHAEGESTIARGSISHAEGYNTIAQGNYSHAEGKYNIGTSNETIHETGIGYFDNNNNIAVRKNAFEIYLDGKVVAPELSNALIDDVNTPDRVLITKEYFKSLNAPSELEKITENGNTGWRLRGRDPDNYGNIGKEAVDFSYSDSPSTIYGATGDGSFTQGKDTAASGKHSHAEGISTYAFMEASHAEGKNAYASGMYSHAEGEETNSTGKASHAEGLGTFSQNDYMHAAGKYNIGTSNETIHETGIGTDDTNKKNAFEIYLDGKVVTPEFTKDLIKSESTGKALVTREFTEVLRKDLTGTEIDWKFTTEYVKEITADTTFTDINLPLGGKTEIMVLHLKGDFVIEFPSYWNLKGGEYDGSKWNMIIADCLNGNSGNEIVNYIILPDV